MNTRESAQNTGGGQATIGLKTVMMRHVMALKYALNRFSMLFSKPGRGAPSSSRIPFACQRQVWSFRIFDACLLNLAHVTMLKSSWLMACSGHSNAVGSG